MHTQHSIKTDSTGNVDTQYYIDRAYQMRREYNAELFASTKRFVKSLFRMNYLNFILVATHTIN